VVVDEDPKVEEAYQHLKNIFVKHIGYAMLESGRYLIQQFYGGDSKKAGKYSFKKNESLNKLFERLQTESSGNVPKKSWLYNSINLAIAEDKYKDVSIYGKLGNSHKLILIGQKKLPKKTKIELMKKTIDKGWSVLDLQKEINKKKNTDGIELSQELPIERLMKLDVNKLLSLKTRTIERERKVQNELAVYQKNLKNFEKAIDAMPPLSVGKPKKKATGFQEWTKARIMSTYAPAVLMTASIVMQKIMHTDSSKWKKVNGKMN
jgi:hypothetical protein